MIFCQFSLSNISTTTYSIIYYKQINNIQAHFEVTKLRNGKDDDIEGGNSESRLIRELQKKMPHS